MTKLSNTQLESADVLSFSLPPINLLGFIFPDLGGFHEFALYSGAVVLILAVNAPVIKSIRKQIVFWFFFWSSLA